MFVHYFARENAQGQPVLRDGTVIVPGMKHHAEGEIILCKNGYHGSVQALDALKYAGGHWYCPRELSGEIVTEDDKVAASDAVTLAVVNVSSILHEFACREAEIALRVAGVTDEHCWTAIEGKRAWLRGEISDKELEAARDAAWVAAWDAASVAASDAASVAASDAAWDAASVAARVAAWDAAWDAASVAAWDAASVAASDAARVAASDAARVAAWDASNRRIEVMLAEAIGREAGG